jgi:enamine deaminase RidA (YjgF/YER057c/UK114 family)
MTENVADPVRDLLDLEDSSEGERNELIALGMLSTLGAPRALEPIPHPPGYSSVERHGISAHSVLNEACDYGSAFSRGLRLELDHYSVLLISGTASIDGRGETVYRGDFRAQCWRTFRNITTLLESEGATWKDIVKTTCYLRDIERDYDEFNRVRTAFYQWNGLDPLPASVGIQARLCREDLLIEIEAMAILRRS